jgi:hypothetical protein
MCVCDVVSRATCVYAQATFAQSAKMHGVVEEADAQFNTLFANAK